MTNREFFAANKYGMMCHWGLYSLLGGEWNGKIVNDYAEWIQAFFAIPNSQYHQLAGVFNPIFFNPDEWMRIAKDCGMTYFVVTSKHHDGFAMFHSKADKFNVVDATPYKRDIIGQFAEACYKHGIKLGLYYSQELDWAHPHGGGYTNSAPCSGVSWDNSWDFPDTKHKDFSICFNEKIKSQVREILTNYGDIFLIWFDTPHTITPAQSLELNQLVKECQPDCLINSRIGNGDYDYVSLMDNEVPPEGPPAGLEAKVGDMNALGGYKYSPYGLYETPATLNSSWGIKFCDQNWRTAEEILAIKRHLNSKGVNYLLNIGPDGLGRIPAKSVDALLGAAGLEK
ncbi:MAG: alpha-L-fucosidase [Defluviitaleaceae bacterium]|nr:alpha-L-fucosidase [Defluviitaleaceae bacterium]